VTMLQNVQDGTTTYNSVISTTAAQVLLSIQAPSVSEPIMVLFEGTKVTGDNYAVTNGGFEGNWSNSEVNGWHSFPSATGTFASMAGGSDQFKQSSDVRPGSTGSHSVMMASNLIASIKANGNCTNGQINAGSMTADDASGNYNFSDPSNSGYNTPFVGNPDSIVFWSKYIPADQNPSNSVNKARMHTVITTNARYQDPESSSYANVKVAEATINYAATSSMGWQRLSVPFIYTSVNPDNAAYVLVTFTTNMTPGGGSTYSTGGLFNKKYYYDNVYLDDVEMIYNHALTSATMNGNALSFNGTIAQTPLEYSDVLYDFAVQTNGKAAQSFIGYDVANLSAHIYVVADNYSQAQAYSVYTVQMAAPTTYGEYEIAICQGDSVEYEGTTYSTVFDDNVLIAEPNVYGGDSIVHLTIHLLPTYRTDTALTITQGDNATWEEIDLSTFAVGDTTLYAEYQTVDYCDSTLVLHLTVEPQSISTGIDTTTEPNAHVRKVILNGRLYIIRDEEMFTIIGEKVAN